MNKFIFGVLGLGLLSLLSHTALAQETTHSMPELKGFSQSMLGSHDLTLIGRTKYKIRALSFTVEPNGSLSSHRHTGAGYVCVVSGQLSSTINSQDTTIKAGDCAYDPGNENHMLKNTSEADVTGLVFEVVPQMMNLNKTGRAVPPTMESLLPPE